MSARDTILLALTRYYQGNSDPRGTAMQVVDGYDAARRKELLAERTDVRDRMLSDAHAAGRAEALAEFATWLVKKSREGFPDAAVLASKVSRGAVRPDNLRMLPPDFFVPGRVYAHDVYRFRCEFIVTHPTHGRRSAWGWFGHEGRGWRHQDFSERQFQVREWTDVTDVEETPAAVTS